MIRDNPTFVMKELDAAVTQNDFEEAIKHISKSVSQNDIKKYEQFTEEYSNK